MSVQWEIRRAITQAQDRVAQAPTDELMKDARAELSALVQERQKLMARKYEAGDTSSLFG